MNEHLDPLMTASDDERPAGAATPAAASPLPVHVGRYRVERLLGAGGFGLVYLAHDDQLQRLVAIKVPHRKLVERPEAAVAYLTEARTVANLDHPHIVPVFDVGSTDEFPCYVVSKYIDGTDLATRLKRSRLAIHATVELVATVAEALHHAHKQGLVHRDVKPSNLLLDKSGKPFVADFGLALREKDVGKGPRYAGTPAYMSPEQARGEGHRVDGRSDIFSLGVVFYELLVGRQPFRADSQAELLEQVACFEARPPRQFDENIPRELERICLKALSKRASERYSTAKDMADDLRHFLAEPSADGLTVSVSASPPPTPVVAPETPSRTPISDQQLIKIVPKGLRSFDAHDADFFLELLPGPRDRAGLPDSIRFWKSRIEEKDADNTFSVGLIYGPSGCGKSSLMKAGLLPRLSDDVIAVYVEATAAETEIRLLNTLRKRCTSLPDNLGLKETLAALRRGQGIPVGKKVVIVLDQFEQWLHAKKEEENTELVHALRQCDGGRVQCVVMVRDDFWMAATRFMRDLEVRLVEAQNSAAVDLFPMRHAEKVLSAFGRAFGVLPENPSETSKDQRQFLEQAVAGLAQENKVICVRLALFAEMMKGRPWTPASLKEVGGMEGVGVTFLDETFSAATAPPEHRYHQKAARADLKALLPETGSDIKGHMRSYAELLEASGYGSRPKDFDELLRILDNEIRLITPTDPEGDDNRLRVSGPPAPAANPQAGSPRYYQLTHDYLVHSLREWLTRKQRETRRGRAELLLVDRAGVWNARPENRQLPSLMQWLQIRWLTQKKVWTPPQRRMMAKAGRYHAVRGMVVGVLLAVATATGLVVRDQIEEQRKATHAAGLVQALLNADTAQTPAIVGAIAEYRMWTDPLLHEEYDKAADKSRQQLHASLALLPVDPSQVDYLYGRLLDAEPSEVPVIGDALAPHNDALLDKLWAVALTPDQGKEPQRLRAAAALAKYDPASEKWAQAGAPVVNDLVRENAMFLGQWSEAFKFVKGRLLAPLSDIFRDREPERAAERTLATNLLADYAALEPKVLADLLMDADEKQFAVIYPKLKEHGDRSVTGLLAEIDKQAVIAKDKMIFESKGTIAEDDAKVKTQSGLLPAKRFEVRLRAAQAYRLTMDSQDFDSFLVLQDKTGKELAFDNDSGGNQNSLLLYTPSRDDTYTVFAASLPNPMVKNTGAFVLKVMETASADDGKEKLAKRQANAAVALLKMNQAEKVWPLLKHSSDPRVRSYLIHRLHPLGADAGAMVKRLNEEPDVTIRRALLLSLGEYGEKDLSPEYRKAVMAKVQGIYRDDADPGLHAASEWLLRKWQEEAWLKQMNDDWAKDGEVCAKKIDDIKDLVTKDKEKTPAQWYVNGQGQTMVVIPGPVTFAMGSPASEKDRQDGEIQHKKRIGRTFALAAKSVTAEQYRQFEKSYQLPAKYTGTAELPVMGIDWYRAARYCNWLSKDEGILEEQWCYEIKGNQFKLKDNYLSLAGYRLPMEAEMEFATRAGALTSRYFGETDELLPKYAWYLKNSQEQTWPVGSLKPNDLGLFDVQGNVLTWCQESLKAYPTGKGEEAAEDKEDISVIIPTQSRVVRGGSFLYLASEVRSADRLNYAPATRNYLIGFRPARTLPLNTLATDQSEIVFSKTDDLTDADAKDTKLRSSRCKVYKIELMEGKGYRIDLNSTDFDTFLRLEDSTGKELGFNDDISPNNLNSRLIYYTPKTGEYRVIVTSFEAGKTGKFFLKVTMASAAEVAEARFTNRVLTFADSPPAEQEKLIQEVTQTLQAKNGKLTVPDAQTLIVLFLQIDDSDVGRARETGRSFAKILAGADNPQIAGAAKIVDSEIAKLDRVGKALEIAGTTTDAKDFDLKNLRGKVVLVNFWATWGGPSIVEIPNIVAAYKKFHTRGFEVIGVSLDQSDDAIVKFAEGLQLPWKNININDSKKLAAKYGVTSVPTSMLVGLDGRVVSVHARGPQLERLLVRLIGDKKAAGKLDLQLLEETLKVHKAKLGADHPDTLTSMNNLAMAYWQLKKFDRSIPLFEELLPLSRRKLGDDHPDTLKRVVNLGINYRDSGRPTDALPLLEEAYKQEHRHAFLQGVGAELVDVYVRVGQKSEASSLLAAMLNEARTKLPPESAQLGGVLARNARLLLQLQAYLEAEKLLRECLAIREKAEPDAWTRFNTQSALGGALVGQKKYADAEPVLLAGYEGMKQREAKIPAQSKNRLTEAEGRLAELFEATRKKEETKLHGSLTDPKTEAVHEVKLSAGKAVVIEMHSKQFNTYLRLEDAKGKTLAENDDVDTAGKNLNSRILVMPKADGVYRIVATSFQQAGRGDYELIIREYELGKSK